MAVPQELLLLDMHQFEKKVKAAKPKADVTTPSTAAIKALKKMNINKICLFTPYSKKLNR